MVLQESQPFTKTLGALGWEITYLYSPGSALISVTNALLTYSAGSRRGEIASTTGAVEAGDGGGGYYYWDPTSVLTADGATVIGALTLGRWIKFI